MEVTSILNRLVDFQNLNAQESYKLFLKIMEGEISPILVGAILTALRMKGETKEEIVGAAKAMREKSLKVPLKENLRKIAIDTCGTGILAIASALLNAKAIGFDIDIEALKIARKNAEKVG
ncbi:MAG TPA: hypothetical protein EYP03_02660 [Aquificae bacterium]|nr:hypothetical protein [Aquificota bacterium]